MSAYVSVDLAQQLEIKLLRSLDVLLKDQKDPDVRESAVKEARRLVALVRDSYIEEATRIGRAVRQLSRYFGTEEATFYKPGIWVHRVKRSKDRSQTMLAIPRRVEKTIESLFGLQSLIGKMFYLTEDTNDTSIDAKLKTIVRDYVMDNLPSATRKTLVNDQGSVTSYAVFILPTTHQHPKLVFKIVL